MKLRYSLILITLLFLYSNTTQSQVVTKAEINLENGEDPYVYINKGDLYYSKGGEWLELALNEYLKAKEFISDKADYNYKIAFCYYHVNNLFESQKYFNNAYRIDPNVTPDIIYRIGQGAQFKLQFDKAIEYFNQFKENYPENNTIRWKEETAKRIVECETGKELLAKFSEGMVVNSTRVNSPYVEHSPMISNDGNTLFFTSRRPTKDLKDKDKYGRYYENIFVAKKNKEGIWQEAENIGYYINSNDNNATVGLSPDNNEIYIYYGGENGGDIYVSSFNDSVWSKPEALPEPINSRYQETAISFSPNKDKAYFVSDRPNGYGGKDIWVATLNEKGQYKNAIALGSVINTPYDERAVFLDSHGTTMYFSSEGHKTMGGFDIFKSVLDEDGNWGAPENIGYPVNTPGDDIFYVTSADNKRAYFSSIKLNTNGEHDIYTHVFSEEDAVEELAELKEDANFVEEQVIATALTKGSLTDSENVVEEQKEAAKEKADNEANETLPNFLKIKGSVKDQFTKQAIQALLVFTESKSGKQIKIESNSEGEYIAEIDKEKEYTVKVFAEEYSLYETSLDLQNSKEQDIFLTVTPEVAADCKPIILKNIQFDFDKASIDKSSYEELNQLVRFLENCKDYKIEVSGYTCNIGTKEYNKSLSAQRAGSILKYLFDKGIKKEKINYKGYGEDNPIGDNTTIAGKIKNRRVEFKLIK